MSSHREAPETSQDPAADNTDVYAFVSPDDDSTVTLIANFIPFENPEGGPNFYEFADDVTYAINVSNKQTAEADISFQFRFTTTIVDDTTFLYNTGPIMKISDTSWNRPQTYTLTMVKGGVSTTLGTKLPVPPCNIGPRSTPDYATLRMEAISSPAAGVKSFAGQRAEPFFVDLGAIFDLLDLRPFSNLHLIPSAASTPVDATKGLNVHTLALQVDKTLLTDGGIAPMDATKATSVIGVWATASRPMSRTYDAGAYTYSGLPVQVSRLGNPLFNEVLVPLGQKNYWNTQPPSGDSQFAALVANPGICDLLPVLYPGVFPNLAALNKAGSKRADLEAILLTGIPTGVVKGFQNYTGAVQADMLRLNMAIPPTAKPNPIGLIAGDPAGFPNGRRVADDVVAIELRALAGATVPLVDPSYKPDAAAALVTDGTTNSNPPYLAAFPYLADPFSGYEAIPALPNSGPETAIVTPPVASGSPVPVGAPQTGAGGTAGGRNRELLEVGAGALAAAVGAGALAERGRHRPAVATTHHTNTRTDTTDGSAPMVAPDPDTNDPT